MRRSMILATVISVLNAWGMIAQEVVEQEKQVSHVLDAWHEAAAKADFETYFGYMADNSIFIGTDATENWPLEAFKEFSKPYFDRGKAWSFTAVERNIFFSKNEDIVWFDELLDTQMKLCRGSGVLIRQKDGSWKIAHYVLSIVVPNERVDEVVALKREKDSILTDLLKKE